MNVRIHRGAAQVGGTCIEVEHDGRRIVLDAGMPMGELPVMRDLLPDVPGLWARGDGALLGVFFSHIHPDHIGLADLVEPSVPVHVGARGAAICRETRFFVPCALDLPEPRPLRDGVPVSLGPFAVTPLAVDHGVDDAFALLVEAGGHRLLYSGDLRGHGCDADCLDRLARRAGRIDVLLLEGTRVGGHGRHTELSETQVEEACAGRIAAAEGAVVAFASAQNLDRVEAIARAARRAGRTPVIDLYGASLFDATGRGRPCEARVRVEWWQRRRIIEEHAFERTRAIRRHRIYDEELAARAGELVIIGRTSALETFESLGLLLGGDALWSMWPGYLEMASSREALRVLRRNGTRVHVVHASGHARPEDLRRLVEQLDPRRVVPVHTQFPEEMATVVGAGEPRADGEWWAVRA